MTIAVCASGHRRAPAVGHRPAAPPPASTIASPGTSRSPSVATTAGYAKPPRPARADHRRTPPSIAYNGPRLPEDRHRPGRPLRAARAPGQSRRRRPAAAPSAVAAAAKPAAARARLAARATSTGSPPRRCRRPQPSRRSSGPATRSSACPTSSAAATPRSSRPATTARAPSPSRCTAAACSPRPRTPPNSCAGARTASGRWVAVFSNPGHAYMTVAGLRLDTSAADDPSNQQGPRWRPLRPANGGFIVRHPLGL